MRLKRLELQGFKSFLDRTILTFEPGITGVVGPNGCGKSNIVDAILWVMGEQSPKHLRGESMTDIIFAGSEHKAPTSMAEVSLVLDKQGVPLAPQFAAFERGDEISVTRRIYRDGTGEFLINRVACRLKDIHELFMDTGVGRRAYSIIEQGQIDRMINVKPEDRRVIFEEVAGITKYKAKRKEAEKKLEQTTANLLRLQDIIAELEKQIRSLKVQATRARKYKELKTELEVLDLHMIGRDLYDVKRDLEKFTERRDTLANQQAELDAILGRHEATATETELKRLDHEKEFERLSLEERNAMISIQKLESELELLAERRQNLVGQCETIRQELEELAQAQTNAEEERIRDEAERDKLIESEAQLESDINARETELSEVQKLFTEAEAERVRLVQVKNETQNQQTRLDTQKQNLTQKIEDGRRHLDRLQAEMAELETQTEEISASLAAKDQALEEIARLIDGAKNDVTEAGSQAERLSSELSTVESDLFEKRKAFHSQKSRQESLAELQKNLEGYAPSAREILLKLDEYGVTAVPLAETIQPESDVEDLVELILGQELNTLVVKDSDELRRLAEIIEEKNLDRVKIISLSEMNALATETTMRVFPPGVEPLTTRIRATEGHESVINHFFGGLGLAADRQTLFDLRKSSTGISLITRESRVVAHSDQSLSAGKPATSSGVFSRRREIQELTQVCADLEAAVNDLSERREQLMEQLKLQEKTKEDLKQRLSTLHVQSIEARKEKENQGFELERLKREDSRNRAEVERLEMAAAEAQEKILSLDEEFKGLSARWEEANGELVRLDARASELRQQADGVKKTLEGLRVDRSAQKERFRSLEDRIFEADDEIGALTRKQSQLDTNLKSHEAEIEGFGSKAEEIKQGGEETRQRWNELQAKLADAKAALNEMHTELSDLREKIHEHQKHRDSVMKEYGEMVLKVQTDESKLENLKGLAQERYQRNAAPLSPETPIDINALPLLMEQVGDTWSTLNEGDREILMKDHVKSIRDKVGRYGEVNLTAIHEFDEIQQRFEFLSTQKTDLEKSMGILQQAIEKIDLSTKTRFSETFDAVQSKFSEIFPILFGGGKGELTMTNPESVLESGVDIMVQPPGKKLQSITLLSGGEKALTAVSLVLSIFARKPSPFCLLDEVDAPLDDANVSRFNTVVKKMAEKTQFIVITHNKKTMEIAEALYGVTMEKAGVSKMTSVRLQ